MRAAGAGRGRARPPAGRLRIPPAGDVMLEVEGRRVKLTHLDKVFWPPAADTPAGLTKGALLQYYADVAPVLLPHLAGRAMVMRRYPDGAFGKSFFMKQAPVPRPEWLATCPIAHRSGKVVDFPLIDDLPALLWVVNLGCIDLNQWYARCDAPDRPDYLHFDLDPGEGADFARVREVALRTRELLASVGMPAHAKTTGSRGLHVYVPIVRGPTQKVVWEVARLLALELARRHPALVTVAYRRERRPPGRILVDYNQNAWGQTLASVYSVRPRPRAPVSTPVTWAEVARPIQLEDFRIDNVPARVAARGDLWAPLLAAHRRYDLERLAVTPPRSPRSRSASRGGRGR